VGFLYGWTLFLVIQTGTIAAVAIGFARYLGVLVPGVSEGNYLIAPVHITSRYAVSLSTAQLVGLLVIAFLTWGNTRGIAYGKRVQNIFTCAKLGALALVIGLVVFGWNAVAVKSNFGNLWQARGYTALASGLSPATGWGLLVAICLAQTGSLFSADAWNNITFTAGEVRNPRRNVPLSLALGTSLVIGLYLLANLAYLVVLPLTQIQNAPSDRVAGAALQSVLPAFGAPFMAIAIMISTFGCINGMVLSGARAYYAMACDRLFFRRAATLNRAHVPGAALVLQGIWTGVLVLPRTYDPSTNTFGNLYSNLLDYVISAALIFYILTIAGVFILRKRNPDAERPYRAFGYPIVPALYMLGAAFILLVLLTYQPSTTWPGIAIVLLGLPVYYAFRKTAERERV